MEKNKAQISGFAAAKKLQVLEKKILKNCSQLLCADISSKSCAEFFLKKWFSRYLVSVILRFRKIVLQNKIINKTRLTKNQENSAHSFGDNYLTNHLVKFLLDKISWSS